MISIEERNKRYMTIHPWVISLTRAWCLRRSKDFDEYFSYAAEKALACCDSHDPARGTLTTLVAKSIPRYLNQIAQRHYLKKKKSIKEVQYMGMTYHGGDLVWEPVAREDATAEQEKQLQADKELLREAAKKCLTPVQREYLNLMLKGHNTKEICQIKGVTKENMRLMYNKIYAAMGVYCGGEIASGATRKLGKQWLYYDMYMAGDSMETIASKCKTSRSDVQKNIVNAKKRLAQRYNSKKQKELLHDNDKNGQE